MRSDELSENRQMAVAEVTQTYPEEASIAKFKPNDKLEARDRVEAHPRAASLDYEYT